MHKLHFNPFFSGTKGKLTPPSLLRYKGKVNPQVEGHVLQLISLLAKASKDHFSKYIVDCIDGMLLMTLTKSLTDCLAVLHQYVPDIKDKIEGTV